MVGEDLVAELHAERDRDQRRNGDEQPSLEALCQDQCHHDQKPLEPEREENVVHDVQDRRVLHGVSPMEERGRRCHIPGPEEENLRYCDNTGGHTQDEHLSPQREQNEQGCENSGRGGKYRAVPHRHQPEQDARKDPWPDISERLAGQAAKDIQLFGSRLFCRFFLSLLGYLVGFLRLYFQFLYIVEVGRLFSRLTFSTFRFCGGRRFQSFGCGFRFGFRSFDGLGSSHRLCRNRRFGRRDHGYGLSTLAVAEQDEDKDNQKDPDRARQMPLINKYNLRPNAPQLAAIVKARRQKITRRRYRGPCVRQPARIEPRYER